MGYFKWKIRTMKTGKKGIKGIKRDIWTIWQMVYDCTTVMRYIWLWKIRIYKFWVRIRLSFFLFKNMATLRKEWMLRKIRSRRESTKKRRRENSKLLSIFRKRIGFRVVWSATKLVWAIHPIIMNIILGVSRQITLVLGWVGVSCKHLLI